MAAYAGPLLDGFLLAECAEFDSWITAERARSRASRATRSRGSRAGRTRPGRPARSVSSGAMVVVTDVRNLTGDSMLAGPLDVALRVGLEQAGNFSVYPRARLRTSLALMGRAGVDTLLARLAEAAGDTATARQAWSDLVELWKDGDPDLPRLVRARRELARLQSGPTR